MDILKDLYYTNKRVIKETIRKLKLNPSILVVGVPYVIIMYLGLKLAQSMSIFGGLIIFLLESAVFSSYLYVIKEIIERDIFDMSNLRYTFTVYLRQMYVLLLILYLFNYAISLFIIPLLRILPFGSLILIAIYFVTFILVNPIFEVIYQKEIPELDSIIYAVNFTRRNIINWLVPNIVFISLVAFFANYIVKFLFVVINTSSYSFNFASKFVILLILAQGVLGCIMIYRGVLFEILTTTSRKRRLFDRLNK